MKQLILIMIAALFGAAACTQTKFSSKSETLSKSVFGGDQATGVISQPGGIGGIGNGILTQPPGGNSTGNVTQGTGSAVPVQFVCSQSEAVSDIGTTVSTAAVVQMKVSGANGEVVCDITSGVKDYIVSNKALNLTACNLSGNDYDVKLIDPAKPTKSLFMAALPAQNGYWPADHIHIKRANTSSPWTASSSLTSFSNLNPLGLAQASMVGVLWASNPAFDRSVDGSECNVTASPLVVNMTPAGGADPGLRLSSRAEGVWFDILGLNAYPRAHAKQLISWIRNPNYMFLALPRHGQVSGVDELFGNNTFGPDYQFAENGFAALAKYDSNHDGVIDARDPVYPYLRLWSDTNFDGIADVGELKSLADFGIASVDLNYDPTYFEQDRYGNQSRMRSTVQTDDGRLHTIFDLWFALH